MEQKLKIIKSLSENKECLELILAAFPEYGFIQFYLHGVVPFT